MNEAQGEYVGLLLKRGQFSEAEEFIKQQLAVDPEDGWALCMLGVAIAGQDRHNEGIELIKRGIGSAPNDGYLYHLLAASLLVAQRDVEAEDALRQAISLDPSDSGHWLLLARLKMARRAWREVLDACDQAIRLNPDDAAAHSFRSTALRLLNRKPAAVESAVAGLRAAPSKSLSHASLGWVHLDNQELPEARDAFCAALAINPNDQFALHGLLESTKSNRLAIRLWRCFIVQMGSGPKQRKVWLSNVCLTFAVAFFPFWFFARIHPPALRWMPLPLVALVLSMAAFVFYAPLTSVLVARDPIVRGLLDDSTIAEGRRVGGSLLLLVLLVAATLLTANVFAAWGSVLLAMCLEGYALIGISTRSGARKLALPIVALLLIVASFACATEVISPRTRLVQLTPSTNDWINTLRASTPWIPLAMFCLVSWLIARAKKQSQGGL